MASVGEALVEGVLAEAGKNSFVQMHCHPK